MRKKPYLDNTLIKKKNLIGILKSRKIRRISPKALEQIEKEIKEEINKLAQVLEQKMIIKGRKTLTKKDIQEAIRENNETEYPEI